MRVLAGSVDALPTDRCVAVEGAAVVRVGEDVVAFENRCLHQSSSLGGGWVKDGILTCPAHFWRYSVPEGRNIGSDASLPSYRVEIVDGEAWVEVPDPPSAFPGLRDVLLSHARDWKRDP